MLSFMTQTITRVRPATRVVNGRTVPDWDATPVSELDIAGWTVQPGEMDEDLANRSSQVARYSALGPAGADITGDDGVRYDGVLYQVDGGPQRWPSPTGGLDHTFLRLVDHQG
jgi:hypothetical protein